MATTNGISEKGQQAQVRIQLTTRHLGLSLPENLRTLLVDTSLRRYRLSTVVNSLLNSNLGEDHEKPTPFDFLINGTFLRTSLDDYLSSNGISAEATLAIEYVRAIVPPLYQTSFEHDDWVSSVDVLSSSSAAGYQASNGAAEAPGQCRILSGSYDGLLRVWNMSSEALATSSSASDGGHTSSIKAAKFISPSQIASCGLDRTIRLWKYTEDLEKPSATMISQLQLYGHKGSIDSLAIHQASSRILSASADHSVGVWSTKKSNAPKAPASLIPSAMARGQKRRKVGPAISIPQRGPLSLLKSHTGPVSSVVFAPNDHTVAYSGSWDHTLKTWDLPTSTCVDTRSTSHSLLSLTTLPGTNLVAAGTSARHITLVDPRISATRTSVMILSGHTNAVVTLAPDPESTYRLLSGSHDGSCRIWDLRSSKSDKDGRVSESMYVIGRESVKGDGRRVAGDGVKVFGACWDRVAGIVSGGEDKRLQINKGIAVEEAA